jgi:ribosome-associated toxin RatA of RatAB toxin-antitoxin module
MCGLRVRWEGKGIKEPNDAIRYEQTKGLLKGLKVIWSLSGEHEKETTLIIDAEYVVRVFFMKGLIEWFVSQLVGRVIDKILVSTKKRCMEL